MVDDVNKKFLVNGYRDIVKNEDGSYRLEPVYKFDDNNELKYLGQKAKNNNELEKRCWRCVYHFGSNNIPDCMLRTEMDNPQENIHRHCGFVANCDAEDVIEPFCIINSMDEMVSYIERAECMFDCSEDYENYFGMEREITEDENTFAETVREYYECGGRFEKIPDKYPSVIFFELALGGIDIYDHYELEWIYIGEV